MTTIALLSVSAGAGHVRAAQALAAAAEARGITAVHIDLMTLVPKVFKKLYADSYLTLVEKAPALWGWLYQRSDHAKSRSRGTRLRQLVERLNTRAFVDRLAEVAPDHVVCTHFLPAQLLSRLTRKGGFATPTWVVVTDFDVHGLWVHDHLAGYFAADEEIAWRMRDRGLTDVPVVVTGIPIMPVFGRPLDRAICAAELGIDPTRKTLLLMSGGLGVGAIDALAERLLAIPGDTQIVALAGRNAELLARLQTLAKRQRGQLTPLGFTTTIERVMATADLAITKPGGLTTSECLAMGLPMIAVAPIPGQEERNADYLLEHGAALKAPDPAGLDFRVRGLLAAPERLVAMRAAALRIARPRAADAVLDQVLGSR